MMSTFTTTAAVLLILSLSGSRAFAFAPVNQNSLSSERRTTQSTASSLQAHRSQDVAVSRRNAILSGTAALSFLSSSLPKHAQAAVDVAGLPPAPTTNQIAKVDAWPGIETLEPMFELKLSIDAMSSGVTDAKNWPYIKKRLDKFFKGAILSEKNFYFGVGLQYMNDIKYSPSELPNYVVMDKQARYDALERTMKNLEDLKKVLGKENLTDAMIIEGYAKDAQIALSSWFTMIPDNELKAVEELFVHVKKADLNRDGRLSDDELATLSIQEQQLWKKRVDKFG